jgi:hypothetical protein
MKPIKHLASGREYIKEAVAKTEFQRERRRNKE